MRVSPATTFAVLTLPSIAFAETRQAPAQRAPAERSAEARLFPRLGTTLNHLWGQEGSILDPNGAKSAGTPGKRPSVAGDAGSGLDPDRK